MKYTTLILLLSTCSIFTMHHKIMLKQIQMPSADTLKNNLETRFHPLAHKLGGKTIFPMEVFMALHSFYNHEDPNKKNAALKKHGPILIENIFSGHPDIANHFKKEFFKVEENIT